jgi:hypothetical protein
MKRSLAVLAAAVLTFAVTSQINAEDKAPRVQPTRGIAQTVTTSAVVEAIDLDSREVTLKGANGKTVTVHADERIRNLDQVKVGDRVNIKYTTAVAVQLKPAGAAAPSETVTEDITHTRPGGKPAGVSRRTDTIVAEITAIDPAKPSVTLRGPKGNSLEMEVAHPEYLKEVHVGDQVQVTYVEAVAVSVVGGHAAATGSSAKKQDSTLTAEKLNREELNRIQSNR